MESWSIKMDVELCEFYFKVIEKLVGNGPRENGGFKPLRKVFQRLSDNNNQCRSKSSKSNKIVDSLEDTLYNRIVWIYQNDSCLSSAIAYHFKKAAMECSKIRNKLLNKKELRICCVNRGSPSDVVALVKALESVVGKDEEIDIHVSIIHSDKKWMVTCLVVLRCLERFQNALWKIDFIEGDFRFSCSNEVIRAIKSADIVSLVNYLGGSEDAERKIQKNIFKRIHEHLEPGSLLFLLDDYQISSKGVAGNSKGEIPGHDLFYESASDLHMLSVAAVAKHFQLYHNYFGKSLCNTTLKLLCRIWLKLPRDYPGGPDLESAEAEKLLEEQKARCDKMARESSLREACFTFEVENYFVPTMDEISKRRKKPSEKKKGCMKAKREIARELREKTQQLTDMKTEEVLEFLVLVELQKDLEKARQEYSDWREKLRVEHLENKESIDERQEIYLRSIDMLLERLEQKYSGTYKLYFKL